MDIIPSDIPLFLKRYYRSTISNPTGTVCHDGDCKFWDQWVCTCGLLSVVSYLSGFERDLRDVIQKYYPEGNEELGKHNLRLDQLRDIPKPVIEKLTEDEIEKRIRMIEEAFHKQREEICLCTFSGNHHWGVENNTVSCSICGKKQS